jgi:hypothetical protein
VRHGWASELNPFAVHSIGAVGLERTIALNLAARLVIVGGLALIAGASHHERARTSARVVLTGVALWWTLVATSNVVVLATALH